MKKKLTEKLQFRHGATITNRIAMAPMQTHSGSAKGFVTEDTLKYYDARSNAAGLIITEFHYVSENGGPCYKVGYPEQLAIYSDDYLEGAKKLAKTIKKDGNKAILQIHHGGRMAVGRYVHGEEVVAPSDSNRKYPARALSDVEIENIINDFGKAVKRAVEAGFDGVEIHGANHYLLQQFFSTLTNHRTDRWGGSLEKRMAFPLAVVKEVKKAAREYAPDDFIIGYRLSPEEIHGDNVGYTYKESLLLVKEIIKEELDYIHLSLWDGFAAKPQNSAKTYAELFKESLDEETKLIIVGGVFDEESAETAVELYADIIAVGRGILVEPKFAQKIEEGKGKEINGYISPEKIEYVKWTPGLLEAFSTVDSIGLPKLPNGASILKMHSGIFDVESEL